MGIEGVFARGMWSMRQELMAVCMDDYGWVVGEVYSSHRVFGPSQYGPYTTYWSVNSEDLFSEGPIGAKLGVKGWK